MSFKGFFVAVATVLFLSGLPVTGQAEDYIYTTNNSTIHITEYTGSGGAVIIPAEINGLPVTSIGTKAFFYCSTLASVTISSNVANIGDNAFFGCTKLTSITIPNNVTNIGEYAFRYCPALISVTIPESVTTIGNNAFFDCRSMTGITVAESNLFYSSSDGALLNKSQTIIIKYPQGKSGNYTIPNSVLNIENNAFDYCPRLESITIGTNVSRIGTSAFISCDGLSTVAIPDSVINVGSTAFGWCDGLTNVIIGSGVAAISGSAFLSCDRLVSFSVSTNNSLYCSVDGILFSKDQTSIISYPAGKAGGYTIPWGVTTIGDSAFGYNDNLTSVIIPATVSDIGENAFTACSALTAFALDGNNPIYTVFNGMLLNKAQTSILKCPAGKAGALFLPDSINSLGAYSFNGCRNLTSVVLPDGLVSLDSGSFMGCSGLTSITIPASVSVIGRSSFSSCSGLTGVYFKGNTPIFGDSLFGVYIPSEPFIYYLPGKTGWSSTFGGRPTVLWNPQIQIGVTSFGMSTNGFGFTIAGTNNYSVLVEACTNLTSGIWEPLQTGSISNGSLFFSDPQSTNYSSRFYRLRMP